MMLIVERHAVRAIVLTPEREILLLEVSLPDRAAFWITPGGGREAGETPEQTLRRELLEEIGLEGFAIGPVLARRQCEFQWGGNRIQQRERLYLVEEPRFEPRMSDRIEARTVSRLQWWPLADLHTTTQAIAPRSLARVVQNYLDYGAPREEPALDVDTI